MIFLPSYTIDGTSLCEPLEKFIRPLHNRVGNLPPINARENIPSVIFQAKFFSVLTCSRFMRRFARLSLGHSLSLLRLSDRGSLFPFARWIVAILVLQRHFRGWIVRRRFSGSVSFGPVPRPVISVTRCITGQKMGADVRGALHVRFGNYVQHLRRHGVAGVENEVTSVSVPMHYAPNGDGNTCRDDKGNVQVEEEEPVRGQEKNFVKLSIANFQRIVGMGVPERGSLPSRDFSMVKKPRVPSISIVQPEILISEPVLHTSRFRMLDFENFAAIIIQSWYRKIRCMKRFKYAVCFFLLPIFRIATCN